MRWRPGAASLRSREGQVSRRRRYRDYALTLALFVGLTVVYAWFDRSEPLRLSGRTMVIDGDSLTIEGQRIRLLGIDAPEIGQVCRSRGVEVDCGAQARSALYRLVQGRVVICHGSRRDRYQRLLAVCTVGDVDLNRHMVESGWAVAYGDYEALEGLARRREVGLWAGEFDRPDAWRRTHGALVEDEHLPAFRLWGWLADMFWFKRGEER